ncbi:MAG: HAMP domain-containing protein [Deltaproteobacteria bacterium]|nr:HAMP domain-containing protein [Deltaproteobacteria bacterium]
MRRHRPRHRLQRRLFRWFGLTIVASAMVVLVALRFTSGDGATLALALLPLLGLVWGASRMIARRLARPAVELARVANELGAGNLSARTALGRRAPSTDDEFVVMHRAFDGMAERIEGQLRAQKELLAAVSHELRTPLARLRLLVELGRDGAASSKTFDELEREVVEIDALVGELIANSRLDFRALDKRSLDAAELGRRALERAGLPPSRLVVEGLCRIDGDEGLLLRALANLLRNAQEHGGGLTRLSIARADGAIRILAEDR